MGGLALCEFVILVALLLYFPSVDDGPKPTSAIPLLSLLFMLVWIGFFTYSQLFYQGAFASNSSLPWGIMITLMLGVAGLYVWCDSASPNGTMFRRFAPGPALLAAFWSFALTVTLFGEKFLGPIRAIIRFGKDPS